MIAQKYIAFFTNPNLIVVLTIFNYNTRFLPKNDTQSLKFVKSRIAIRNYEKSVLPLSCSN